MPLNDHIESLINLGWQSVLHYLKMPFVKRTNSYDRFSENYIGDGLTWFSSDEVLELSSFEQCISCLACDMACPLYNSSGETFLGPSFLPRAASRSMPSAVYASIYITLFDKCTNCNICESVCPKEIPFPKLRKFVLQRRADILKGI